MKNWFKSKLNIAIVCCIGGFLVLALLGRYLWAPLSPFAMLLLSVALLLFGLQQRKKYKETKKMIDVLTDTGQLDATGYKKARFELGQLSFQYVMICLLALLLLYIVIKGIIELF